MRAIGEFMAIADSRRWISTDKLFSNVEIRFISADNEHEDYA